MDKKFYSQHNEEEVIMKYLPNVKKGKYIDIGCAGRDLSNTIYFYNQGWRGLIIDPGLEYRNGFSKLRPEDIFLPVAITDYNGKVKMCTATIADTWLGKIYINKEGKADKCYMADCMTMDTLIEKYPEFKEVDFLNIDIETGEDRLLAKCNFEIFKPKLIYIEYTLRGVDGRLKWGHHLAPYYDLKETQFSNAFYLRKDGK